MDVEWDERKAARNREAHGVDFRVAVRVFYDVLRLELIDDRDDYGEERWVAIGYAGDRLLYVVYTLRDEERVIRLISARPATRREALEYHENIRS